MATPAVLYQTGLHAARPAVGSGCVLYSCTTHGLVYRDDGTAWTTFLTIGGGTPGAHAASHQNGGSDEIDVTGLTGLPTWADLDDAHDAHDHTGVPGVGGGGGGGLAQSYLGTTTPGATPQTVTAQRVYMKKVSPAAAFDLQSIDFYMRSTSDASAGRIFGAIFEDNAGTPRYIIGANAVDYVFAKPSNGVNAARWFDIPMGGHFAAGDYWIAVQIRINAVIDIYKDGSGSDRYFTPGGDWLTDAGYSAITTTTDNFSIRGSILS